MSEPVRKYQTEFGLNMFGSNNLLLQYESLGNSEISKYFEQGPNCHIYMICRMPRIGFDPATLQLTDTTLSGNFTIQRGASVETHPFQAPHVFGTSDLSLSCPYPHNELFIHTPDGKQISHVKVPLILASFGPQYREHLDLEVLYVGQAYGEHGSRVAPDRLKSHSTLQHIYAEALHRSPDTDIWIILWGFELILLTSIDGVATVFGTTDEDDNTHVTKVLQNEITEQQQISFTEAALIRYFQPDYNTIFKDTFPNPAHKTYSECYDIDLNSVTVEIQTENLGRRIWSKSAEKRWTHFATFPFHSKDERKHMLDVAVRS